MKILLFEHDAAIAETLAQRFRTLLPAHVVPTTYDFRIPESDYRSNRGWHNPARQVTLVDHKELACRAPVDEIVRLGWSL